MGNNFLLIVQIKLNQRSKIQLVTQMQNHFLQTFISSYLKCLPQKYSKLINKLLEHPNLIVYHPIIATGSTHPLNIKLQVSQQSKIIPKGVNVFMLSASQGFSNIQLVGAGSQDRVKVQNFFQQFSKQYQMLENEEIRGLLSLMIQIYANSIQTGSGQMPLHSYASLLMDEAHSDPKNVNNNLAFKLGLDFSIDSYTKYMRSFHLQNIIKSYNPTMIKMYKLMSDNFIRTTTSELEFLNLMRLVRAQMREIHENSKISNLVSTQPNQKVEVLSPLLSTLQGSFQPNCILVGKYFTHLRQSFFCLQTLRPIAPGEQLTVPNRKKLNNYEKLLRYGYKQLINHPDNLYNEYILIINLMDPQIPEVQQIFESGSLEEKKICLSMNNLKMKSNIKILNNGYISNQDLKMLRILFGVIQEDKLEQDRILTDKKIYQFVGKFVQASLQVHLIEKKKVTDDQKVEAGLEQQVLDSFRIIEKGQIQILSNFMKVKKQICGN